MYTYRHPRMPESVSTTSKKRVRADRVYYHNLIYFKARVEVALVGRRGVGSWVIFFTAIGVIRFDKTWKVYKSHQRSMKQSRSHYNTYTV